MNRFGIGLDELMENYLSDTLLSERSNGEHIHLCRVDNYWVAFERSAFRLCHIYTRSVINAMKVFRVPLPIVMTSVGDREMPLAVGDMEYTKKTFVGGVYKTEKPANGRSFNEWRYQNTIVFQNTGYRGS